MGRSSQPRRARSVLTLGERLGSRPFARLHPSPLFDPDQISTVWAAYLFLARPAEVSPFDGQSLAGTAVVRW